MSCVECNYQFSPISSKFYCCQRNLPVCLLCRRKACRKCNKLRTNQIGQPFCDKCRFRKKQSQLLCETKCGKFYCSQCLSQIFRNAYQKVNLTCQINNANNILVKLYCGDEFPYNDLFLYFLNYCVECGRNYSQLIDYQLIDLAKLCSLCFRNYGNVYQSKLLKCLCCQTICRNSSKTMNLQGQAIVCVDCFKQSNIEENVISASRIVQSNLPPVQQNNFIKKQNQQFQQNNFKSNKQPIPNKTQNKANPFQKQSISNPQQIKMQKKQNQVNKLDKLFKKQSFNQLKQKKEAQKAAKKSQKSLDGKTILSKFSSQFQEFQGDSMQENIKLKKHLSNQTVIENFKLQIKVNNSGENDIICQQCEITIDKNCLLKNQNNKRNFQVSTVSKLQNKKKLCRCCFANSLNKFFLGFSNQLQDIIQRQRHVSAPKQKPSHLHQSPQKNQQKQNFNKINSQLIPNKQNTSSSNNNSKYLKLSSDQNRNFGKTSMISTTDYKNYTDSKYQVNESVCKLCHYPTNSFVKSLKHGQICMNCYNKKW